MALQLPTLVHDPKTKTGNEFYVYYNLGVGKVIGTIAYDGTQVQKVSQTGCGPERDNPVGGFAAAVNISENEAAIGDIPAQSPLFTAAEIDSAQYSEDINDYTIAPTVKGDAVQIVTFPPVADDQLICYDNGFAFNPGQLFRAIPRKYNAADHFVRQRFEGSITLNDMYVSNWDGLQRIRGRLCTIIVRCMPDGGGLFSEIYYFGNVRVNPQMLNNPSDGNASMEISAEGNFSYVAVFSAQPT